MHSPVILYQFTLCPFCNKVRAALDLKGIEYETVEVSPRTKVELPELPDEAPRKVPVLRIGTDVLYDSTDILMQLDTFFPSAPRLLPTEANAKESAEKIEAWVDDQFIKALPTVIYGSWSNAARAARTIGRASKFGFLQGMGVKLGGPAIMRLVAGRILKKAGRTDGRAWIKECLDQFETWLGDSKFVGGDEMTLADVAMLGGITCVDEFPVYQEILSRPKIAAWHERLVSMRQDAMA
ncbi:MAG: glutathione S-transferase family protein [Myxococcota bacterium]|nr:glutathione S-transferase family protein [Myxococcota bacterium]